VAGVCVGVWGSVVLYSNINIHLPKAKAALSFLLIDSFSFNKEANPSL
jgi:hypothetical protein